MVGVMERNDRSYSSAFYNDKIAPPEPGVRASKPAYFRPQSPLDRDLPPSEQGRSSTLSLFCRVCRRFRCRILNASLRQAFLHGAQREFYGAGLPSLPGLGLHCGRIDDCVHVGCNILCPVPFVNRSAELLQPLRQPPKASGRIR